MIISAFSTPGFKPEDFVLVPPTLIHRYRNIPTSARSTNHSRPRPIYVVAHLKAGFNSISLYHL
jgi:hypothetical protein